MARNIRRAVSVRDAQDRILARVSPMGAVDVALLDASGRVLAEPVNATLTQPPFDASAMDGYAVRARDVDSLPVTLTVIGESAAGHGFDGHVLGNHAVRIFTGAPLPRGADAIVIQENTRREGDFVEVVDGKPDPKHIRPKGGDFAQGDTLIQKGQRLGPSHLTLVAAMGHGSVRVAARPVVAILATGDELVEPGCVPGPNQIVASNAVGIAGMVVQAGGEPRLLGIAQDTRDSLREKIAAAEGADVLVTIGGASVGDHDLVGPVLSEAGMDLDFWNIAMRPGKPLLFGRLGKQRVIGVPGNPVSSMICARVFLVPLVRSLLGIEPAVDFERHDARLMEALPANGPREHYMRGVWHRDDSGTLVVKPMPNQDSSLMVPLISSNCLIVRENGAAAADIGTQVAVLGLDF